MYIFTDIVQDIAVREAIVARLKVVGLGKDARKLFARGEIVHNVRIRKVVRRDKVSFGRDNVGRRRISRTQEFVEIFQGVFIENDIRVHADNVIILGCEDTHVSCGWNRKGIFQLASLNQSKIELITVIHVNLLNVVRRIVVHDDALELKVGKNLLLGQSRQCLAHNFVLIKGRKDAGKVNSIGVQRLLVGNGQWNLGRKGGTPFSPRVQTRTLAVLIVRLGV
mmetsp:Transcript_27620/g.49999  ORF Transcript_27620/g.49999 Transcript_27620/m.49999 type:complete len:223 (-) Transcript_27620:626-1294(-)